MDIKAKWLVDEAALAEACKTLELEFPVSITPTTQKYVGKYHGIGLYGPAARGVPFEVPTHSIQIQSNLQPSSANSVVWHELTHAAQAERFMPEEDEDGRPRWKLGLERFTTAYAREASKTGGFSEGSFYPSQSYTGIGFEQEANQNVKYARECQVLVADHSQWRRWRVDYDPTKGEPETFYCRSAWEDAAIQFVKDKRGDKGKSTWNYNAYPLEKAEIATPRV